MLKPSMNELMKRVGNRYLLVNLAAQRARDLSDQAEANEDGLLDKAVKLALMEIADGKIVYRPGPRVETVVPTVPATDLAGTLDLDFTEDEELLEELEEEEENEDNIQDEDDE